MCSRAPRSTKNISWIMCFRVHTQHKQEYIYIINNWLMSNIEKKSSCSYAVRYSTQYKNKNIKIIIIINRHMPISVRSKIRDITFGNNGAGNGLFITNFSSIQSILVFLSFYGLIGRGFSNPWEDMAAWQTSQILKL